jgi:putative acetyltransferase
LRSFQWTNVIYPILRDRSSALLKQHLAALLSASPPESKPALDLEGPRRSEITFWTVWTQDGRLVGCRALEDLGDNTGEAKSMRTP